MDKKQVFIKDILLKNYPEELVNNIINGYKKKNTTLRVNNLKSNILEIEEELNKNNINYNKVDWYKDAFIILNGGENIIKNLHKKLFCN